MKEAFPELYEKEEAGLHTRYRCLLCPTGCIRMEGETGDCNARGAKNGAFVSFNYGEIGAQAVDPIEKKPFYHFHPGSSIYSIGNLGCNLHCLFCQNFALSQPPFSKSTGTTVRDVIKSALASNAVGIAFTYAEPTAWYEFVYDVAVAAKEAGLLTALVTNGYINERPLLRLLQVIDAVNVDLKGDNALYRALTKGAADPVKRTITRVAHERKHLEVTTLVIPGKNDTEAFIESAADFLNSLNPKIPYHLSRYYPQYKMTVPPTNEARLMLLAKIAKERLPYVYVGNVDEKNPYTDTYCPNCASTALFRAGYRTHIDLDEAHRCRTCGYDFSNDIAF